MTATLDGHAIDLDAVPVDYTADLERQVRQLRRDAEHAAALLDNASRDLERQVQATLAARRDTQRFRQQVWEAIAAEADARDWCSEADQFLENLGLPSLDRVWSVAVPVVGMVHVVVSARSESDAKELASQQWSETAGEMSADDYLESSGYSSDWDAEVES